MTENKMGNSAIGNTLSHYRILKKLGAGGMGEVYLAEDPRLRRKVALKVLPSEIAEDANRLQRFEQEALSASALNHPNILTVYEFGEENGVYFLATELVEGKTLREKISAGELTVNDALNVAEQIAFALTAAHEAGIVHRDIKPENIMIRRDRIVKVLDFGIAKLVSPVADAMDSQIETLAKFKTQTKEGTIIGTLHYMSPEQVRGQPVDARSDIFSLGIVIYEMLTGKAPFNKPTAGDVIAAILTEHPPPVAQTGIEAPPELQRIIGKSLKKNRDERYQNSKDLLLDIKSLEREIEFPTNPGSNTADENERQTDNQNIHTTNPLVSARQFPFRLLSFLLLAVLLAGGIWWFAAGNIFKNERLQAFTPKTIEVANWKSSPGEIYTSGSISPDGKMIAFTSTRSGAKNIWIKQLAGGDDVQITKDETNNQNPVWSPEGNEIAYFSVRSGAVGIWRVSAFGGSPVFLKTIEDGAALLLRWSKTGTIFYEARGNVFAFDPKSGQTAQITNLTAGKAKANSFAVSHDEKNAVFISSENKQYSVWTIPLSGGEPQQIFSQPEEIRNAVWCADGERVLYSSMTGGIFQIFAADANNAAEKPTQITFGERDAFALDVSADGAKILYGSSKEESDLWGANIEKENEFPVAADITSELWADASPDGKMIAYQSIKNLSQGDKIFSGAILTKTLGTEAQPFQLVSNGFFPVWSPNGKQLAFIRDAEGKYNLWTVNSTGGEEIQLTSSGLPSIFFSVLPYNRSQTSIYEWSPDGKSIAYVTTDEQKRRNIWLVNADGSGKIRLTDNADSNLHIFCPLWTSDGTSIAYSLNSNKPINGKNSFSTMLADLQTKNSKLLFKTDNFHKLLGWSASEKELLVATIKKNNEALAFSPMEVEIVLVDIYTGLQKQLTKLELAYLYNISLSSDKKMLGFVAKKDGKDNVWILRLNGDGKAEQITSNTDPKLYFSSLAWSPDNRAVYFGKQTRYSLLSLVNNFK